MDAQDPGPAGRLGACRRNHDDSKKWDGYPTRHPSSDRSGSRHRRNLRPSGIDEASDALVRHYSERLLAQLPQFEGVRVVVSGT
jgi:hypothetical protein